jgi:hypothetical protein
MCASPVITTRDTKALVAQCVQRADSPDGDERRAGAA